MKKEVWWQWHKGRRRTVLGPKKTEIFDDITGKTLHKKRKDVAQQCRMGTMCTLCQPLGRTLNKCAVGSYKA